MKKQLDQQEIYGDIPCDRPALSPDYLRSTLPKHVQDNIAARKAGKPEKKNKAAPEKVTA